jgi:hypothetical protein
MLESVAPHSFEPGTECKTGSNQVRNQGLRPNENLAPGRFRDNNRINELDPGCRRVTSMEFDNEYIELHAWLKKSRVVRISEEGTGFRLLPE